MEFLTRKHPLWPVLTGPIVTDVGCKTCRATGRELYLKKGKTKERVCRDCKGTGKFTIPAIKD